MVLVADDDEDVRALISAILSEDGYQVITAGDGEQAVRLAARCSPDVCVLDVMMPALDGYDVTRVLKNSEPTQRMPIVLLNALVSTTERRGAAGPGPTATSENHFALLLIVSVLTLSHSTQTWLDAGTDQGLPAGLDPRVLVEDHACAAARARA